MAGVLMQALAKENVDALTRAVHGTLGRGMLQPGLQLIAEDQEGNPQPIWFVTVDDNAAVFTTNHPLAGRTLNFAIEIVGVRDALPIELEHGHPHGVDGTDSHSSDEEG